MLPEAQRLHGTVGNCAPSVPADAVAVLMNARARRVTERLVRAAEALVGSEHVFYSSTLAEAERFAGQIVHRGYRTVICGGGDGTLMTAFNFLKRHVDEANAWRAMRQTRFGEAYLPRRVPRLAFLSLGTGNALRHVAGAGEPLADLRTIVAGRAPHHHRVSLIHGLGSYFTFAGLGYDSLLLSHYNQQLRLTDNVLLRPVFASVLGYFFAVFSRTLPKVLAQAPLEVEVRAQGPACRIDPRRGDSAVEVAQAPLYRGPVSMLGVGTTPFFGYGLRMFPFAGMRPEMMQLRVAKIPPLEALRVLPQVWRGNYRNADSLFDFLVTGVEISLSRPFPFQHSGEDQGPVDRFSLRVAKTALELVDLYRIDPAA